MPAAARHRGRHRKPRNAKRERGFDSRRTAARPIAAAATVALAGATVFAGAPAASAPAMSPAPIRVVNADVTLTGSVLNVAYNLFADVVNIPQNENNALNYAARSLFFSGPWFVVSASNLWGVDPGDPTHFQAVTNFLIPIPALSGMTPTGNDANADGFGGQLWHLMAALLPINSACDAQDCLPAVAPSPITGIGGVDSIVWYLRILTFQQKFPLTNNWFKLSTLAKVLGQGYTYADNPEGVHVPSGLGGGTVNDIMGFPGTTGDDLAVPWADQTFKLQPLKPIANYVQHLWNDTPATNPIQLPNLVQLAYNLQALAAAAVVAWDPFTPGSPFCPGDCGWAPALNIDYPDIVRAISNILPGNPLLVGKEGVNGALFDGWLTSYDKGLANGPTQDQIDRSIELLQQPLFDFGNPLPPDATPGQIRTATFFHKLWKSLGFPVGPCPACDPPNLQPITPAVSGLREKASGQELALSATETPATDGSVDDKTKRLRDIGTPKAGRGGVTTAPSNQGSEPTPRTGPKKILTGSKGSTGTNPSTGTSNGSSSSGAPKAGNFPSLSNALKKVVPHNPRTTNSTKTGAAASSGDK